MEITLWDELLLFAILMAFSGFFSSSETSLFSLSKLQMEQMRRDDNPKVGLIERLLSEPRRLIVTILIGNEFVNVAASVISAAIVIRLGFCWIRPRTCPGSARPSNTKASASPSNAERLRRCRRLRSTGSAMPETTSLS